MSKGTEALAAQPTGEAAMVMMNPALLVRSKTNPRTHFDETYLDELADSIRQHGVLQPILARPLPASRLLDTFEDREHGAPLPTHEIVCGECRWRSSRRAEVDALPVLIRQLDDLQVLQVQLVENLRRKDLHPLEEAEGFRRLMDDHHLQAEDIGKRVGKSESYVYKSLKLLELTTDCREEMYAGKLTQSTALLVARQPAYLQAQIAKDIMRPDFDGEPLSYRQASRHIKLHYMLQLATAPFDVADADLVPAAGDCKSCPKRSGANSALFEDVESADTCTDPKCFEQKREAHFEAKAAVAKAKGRTVIMGKEAQELMPHEHSAPKGYRLLDEKDYYQGEGYKSLRSVIGKAAPQPVLILNPHSKQLQEALPTEVASKLVKQAQAKAKKEGDSKGKKKKPSAADLEVQFEDAWHSKAAEQIHAALMAGTMQTMSVAIARHICVRLAAISLWGEGANRFCRLFGIENSKVGRNDAVSEFLTNCSEHLVAPALLMILIEDEIAGDSEPGAIEVIAGECQVDLETIKDEAKAAMRAEVEPEPEPPKKDSEKSQPKKKTTTKEAKAGIASAMQEQDSGPETTAAPATPPAPTVGTMVRIHETARPIKIRGHQGSLAKRLLAGDWMVAISGKEYRLPRTHFEILPPEAPSIQPVGAWPFPLAKSSI